MKSEDCILFCSCSGRSFLSDDARRAITIGLQESGHNFTTIPDLCGMTIKIGGKLKEIVDHSGRITIIACYPRAVKWLFAMAGIEWKSEKMNVINARKESAEKILEKIRRWNPAGQETCTNAVVEGRNDQWDPWFPVIDYERCENCKQCLSFCLFGVYVADKNDKVEVGNPKNCKNNCPACARICPKAAIIFPKHTESPVDGSEIENEAELRDKIKTNVSEILGNDIYAALAERRKKAKRLLIRKDDVNQAEQERKKFSGQG